MPKKRIQRAEFNGIFLDFVECGIAKKMEGPYYCLKRRISTLNKLKFSWNSDEIKLKFRFLGRNTDFSLYGQFHIPQNSKLFHGIPPVEPWLQRLSLSTFTVKLYSRVLTTSRTSFSLFRFFGLNFTLVRHSTFSI